MWITHWHQGADRLNYKFPIFAISGGGCSAPVGVSTRLKPVDDQHKLHISGAVWSLDGTTRVDHSLDHTFPQITRSTKHKLSPTEDDPSKRLKVDSEPPTKLKPHEQTFDKTDNASCEDTRSLEEIQASKNTIYCGLTENLNIPIEVITKCDSLGKELANSLIAKGALDVMKVSQDFIRNSTANKSWSYVYHNYLQLIMLYLEYVKSCCTFLYRCLLFYNLI